MDISGEIDLNIDEFETDTNTNNPLFGIDHLTQDSKEDFIKELSKAIKDGTFNKMDLRPIFVDTEPGITKKIILFDILIAEQNLDLIKSFVNLGVLDVEPYRSPADSYLARAIKSGNLEIVKLLFSKPDNAAYERLNDPAITPFYLALATKQDKEMLKEIVSYCNRDLFCQPERLGLCYLKIENDPPIMPIIPTCNILHSCVNYFTLQKFVDFYHRAVKNDRPACDLDDCQIYDLIYSLLDHFDDKLLDNRDSEGYTAFQKACFEGNLEFVQQLHDFIGTYFWDDEQGQTGLHLACQYGHLDIVDFLMQDVEDYYGDLMDKGAEQLYDIREPDVEEDLKEGILRPIYEDLNKLLVRDDTTPLYIACQQGHFEIVELLYEKYDRFLIEENGYFPRISIKSILGLNSSDLKISHQQIINFGLKREIVNVNEVADWAVRNNCFLSLKRCLELDESIFNYGLWYNQNPAGINKYGLAYLMGSYQVSIPDRFKPTTDMIHQDIDNILTNWTGKVDPIIYEHATVNDQGNLICKHAVVNDQHNLIYSNQEIEIEENTEMGKTTYKYAIVDDQGNLTYSDEKTKIPKLEKIEIKIPGVFIKTILQGLGQEQLKIREVEVILSNLNVPEGDWNEILYYLGINGCLLILKNLLNRYHPEAEHPVFSQNVITNHKKWALPNNY